MHIFQNNIRVFCPAITDGSIGDILYFHSYKNPGLILDLVEGSTCIPSMATCREFPNFNREKMFAVGI